MGSEQSTAEASGQRPAEPKPDGRWSLATRVGVRLRGHGSSIALFVVGVFCLAAAIWVVPDQQAVATALVAFGVAQVVLGAVLSRAEGPTSITPQGIRTVLRPLVRTAIEANLDEEETITAAERALTMYSEAQQRSFTSPRGRWVGQIPGYGAHFANDPGVIAASAVASVLSESQRRESDETQSPEQTLGL
jgi:hypothetical protein